MISLTDITVKYWHREREVEALDGVTLSVREKEFLCIIGPSGCGKSTLLHVLAGFVKPSVGNFLMDGIPILGPSIDRGIVFQRFSLFPWKTVKQNIEIGLVIKKVSKSERDRIVNFFLTEMELSNFSASYPNELSIGMQQRVALARAFANNPKILLMDEPFASLDAQTSLQMRELLLRIWQQETKTVIFVTHDIEEAITLADRIIVLSARPGKILKEFKVDLPRPRNSETFMLPEYIALRKEITSTILR